MTIAAPTMSASAESGDAAVSVPEHRRYPDNTLEAIPPEYDDAWQREVIDSIDLDASHTRQWEDLPEDADKKRRFVREYLFYHLRILGPVPLHGQQEIRDSLMKAFTYDRCRSGDMDD